MGVGQMKSHINYILSNMYYLKYFIPLIVEGNRRGIEARMFTFYRQEEFDKFKDAKRHPYANVEFLKNMAKKFNFKFDLCNNDKDIEGLTFLVEKRGLSNFSSSNSYKVVLTCMLEFVANGWYDEYIDVVDNVIFPSEFFAKKYGKMSSKNLYLGSPKYDIEINKKDVMDKYGITSSKNALILFPHIEKLTREDFKNFLDIYNALSKIGFSIIVKDRSRQLSPSILHGDKYITDVNWFPSESIELINACDLVIGFDTGGIKECVIFRKPYINFHISSWLPYEYFYKYNCCVNLTSDIKSYNFAEIVDNMITKNFTKEFDDMKNKYFFDRNVVCKNILDYFQNKGLILGVSLVKIAELFLNDYSGMLGCFV